MSSVRLEFFAEASPELLQLLVNAFLSKDEVEYVGHSFAADGLEKPYNLCLAYREEREDAKN